MAGVSYENGTSRYFFMPKSLRSLEEIRGNFMAL